MEYYTIWRVYKMKNINRKFEFVVNGVTVDTFEVKELTDYEMLLDLKAYCEKKGGKVIEVK